MAPISFYEAGLARCKADLEARERRSSMVSTARLVLALGAIVSLFLTVWGKAGALGLLACVVFILGFIALVIVHGRVIRARDIALAGTRYHERGLLRLRGEHGKLPVRGEGLTTETHPYAKDLDLFGQGSLLQLVDATQTAFGEKHLVRWLDGSERASFPEGLSARQEAVKDLVKRSELREKLAVLGAVVTEEGKPDPSRAIAWAESKDTLGGAWFVRAWPFVVIASIVLARMHVIPAGYAWTAYGIAFAYSLATRARAQKTSEALLQHEGGVRAYLDLIALVEREKFDAPHLRSLSEKLANASSELGRLGTIVGFLEARSNEVFRLFLAPLILLEHNCVLWLESWRARSGAKLREWFEVLGQIEALSSLAQLSFDNPDWAFPELSEKPCYVAEALGHPLIGGQKRKNNDVTLDAPGTALVVTGSNMSGKSTLLRSMGLGVVLALAGAPVCARKMKIGPLRLATSMRVTDSLEEGTSRFYAELKRLKLIVGMANEGPGVFFLLDEVLHGTNTRERLIGARAVVRSLLSRGALGAVSTHDLALGDLEEELRGSAKNVHFQEQVEGDVMSFDYKLREGVVQSSNALRLMKAVGLEVDG